MVEANEDALAVTMKIRRETRVAKERAVVTDIRNVHNPTDFLLQNQITQVRAARRKPENGMARNASGIQHFACSSRRVKFELMDGGQLADIRQGQRLVGIANGKE